MNYASVPAHDFTIFILSKKKESRYAMLGIEGNTWLK